jgi:MFS family permease
VALSEHSIDNNHAWQRFSPNVTVLGIVSALTAMSSAMIYGLLPVFLVRVLGVSMASVGVIEGVAESANSFVKILSGAASDRLGRRKPLVVLGYALSAVVKTLFPTAGEAGTVLVARVIDRLGKGIRDAPRDAFLADMLGPNVRGSGFGWRLALAITGFAIGPLLAVGLMRWSDGDFRLVFWVALIPAYVSVVLLVLAVTECPSGLDPEAAHPRLAIRRSDLAALPHRFWWVIVIASLLSLARFSQAFLVLKVHDIGVEVALVPLVLIVTHLVYSGTAYPFGILADRIDWRSQLAIGAVILLGAQATLAVSTSIAATVIGAALWGLQLGATQGLLGAVVADAAPDRLRGTAFGIYDVAVGVATFAASAAAGVLWTAGGPAAAFGTGAGIAAIAAVILIIKRPP